jgi:hypothetical protein
MPKKASGNSMGHCIPSGFTFIDIVSSMTCLQLNGHHLIEIHINYIKSAKGLNLVNINIFLN